MKKTIKFSWTGFIVVTALSVGWIFYGCGSGGGGGSTTSAVSGSTRIAAQIVDAKDDSTLLSTTNGGPAGGFDVTFSANGQELKTVNTTTGAVTCPADLKAGTVVNVEVVPKDSGGKNDLNFLSNSVSLTTDQNGYATGKVRVLNRNDPPAGAAVGVGTVTAGSDGAIKSDFSLTAVPTASGVPTASVSIPAGTILKDKNKHLLTGTLTVLLAYFPSTADDTSMGYPGGPFTMMQDDDTSGAFVTAGFMMLEIMDSSGKLASSISSSGISPEIIMEISNAITNPDTGSPVAVNDIVPLWSFDTGKGKWVTEGNETVAAGGSTGLRISFNPAHFSYWAIAWLIPPHCTGKINFTGNTAPLNVVISGKGFGYTLYQLANYPQATIAFIPTNLPVTIKAYAYGSQVKINGGNSITVPDWCSLTNNTLDLQITIPGTTNRAVSAKYYCPTDFSKKAAAPGIPILICKKTSKGYSQCDLVGWTNTSGLLSFDVIDNSKLTLGMYKNQLYEADGDNAISLPNENVCGTGSTGGTGGSGLGTNF